VAALIHDFTIAAAWISAGRPASRQDRAGGLILKLDECELGTAVFEPVIMVMIAGISAIMPKRGQGGRRERIEEVGASTEKPVSRPARRGAQHRG
jgi:hypothetical protein